MGKRGKLTGAVVDHTHFYAAFGLAREYFEYTAPHVSFADDEVFKKNEVLCALQLTQQGLEFALAGGEIGRLCAVICRIAAGAADIPGKARRGGKIFVQLQHCLL